MPYSPPTEDEIKALVVSIIEMADYDLGKMFDPELAEEPDEIDSNLAPMVEAVRGFLKDCGVELK